ncbi:MAG: FAD-dependent oxidoreductase [Chloroflexi bacterium HGW-Chloroflexi-10]|nr:MAG: FAD-dependent oxidoreductase [Chloroflexi bacterium HGW-Chloroflexi-10]
MNKPQAIVIGAGFTGVAVAYDLAQRGFVVTVVERGPFVNGTSGRTHGLLHSGARYAVDDQESAIECIDENTLLRKIAPQVIEPNGGLFVGLNDADLAYRGDFIKGCETCHIQIEEISPQQALKLEPNLTPDVKAAFMVPDGTFDPLRLALAFAASAKALGARFRLFCEVEGFLFDGQGNVSGVRYSDRAAAKTVELHADMVVNATGAWSGEVAALAGDHELPIKPTPGVMVAYDKRLCQRVINRLFEPGDGDIIVPQRQMITVGTTSFEAQNLDYIPVFEEQVKLMFERGVELIPAIAQTRERGAFMASRPLVDSGTTGRSLARTFKCFDHKVKNNIDGLVTITGGKATTLRLMAEKTVDLVCQKMGIDAVCRTAETPLLSYRQYYVLPDVEA